MSKLYEVVFYSGDQLPPAYYVIDQFESDSPGEIKSKLAGVAWRVKNLFNIGVEIADYQISEHLYIIQEDSITQINDIAV